MDKKKDLIAGLCKEMARATVVELATELNNLPLPDDEKMSMLLTVEISMLTTTLDGMHIKYSTEEKLTRKLDFLRIMKRNFIREANTEKEKSNDNG
jgi:hypothetical protein